MTSTRVGGKVGETARLASEDRSAEVRLKSRLLTTFLILILVVIGAVDAVALATRGTTNVPWFAYLFVIGGLALNRAGSYHAAALLTLSMFPFVTFATVLSGSDPRIGFSHLVTGVIASSLLLSRARAIAFDVTCLVLLALTPILMPERVPSLRTILSALVLLALGSGLSILLLVHRDEVERDRQAALRASEERQVLALDAAHMGTWEWNTRDGVVRWSERVEAMCGVARGGLGETADGYFQCVHADDREQVEKMFRDAVAGKRDEFEVLHRILWRDGSERWIQVQGRATDGPSHKRRVNGTVLDVTDRKIAEAERDVLIQELEEKNAELERFTFTVSHDLKSPLITVRGFLSSIQNDVKEGRTDRLDGDIARIFNATSRMQKLLDELLNLSRIGRIVNPPERVDFADLAREVATLVRGRLDASHAELTIHEPLPEVYGDRSRLVQVLQNLLDNAAKFLGDQERPQIVVGSRPPRTDGLPVLFVQDNGIGIEPRFLERMTGLFEKMDERGEGTGVGLAIVKRIVEFHGGRLWLESAGLGKGTTACFTLKTPPADA